jgi:AcrR family transcriptional regulator
MRVVKNSLKQALKLMAHRVFSVTVKDVCNEAKLTERYFYESFKKSEDLFQTIFLKLIETLQQNVMQASCKLLPIQPK